MPESEPKRIGLTVEVKPHAYDPIAQPELFEGVLARRMVAFLIDVVVITVPLLFLAIFIFMFGLVTLGLGWFLFLFYGPIAVIWVLVYYGLTFGNPDFVRYAESYGAKGTRVTSTEDLIPALENAFKGGGVHLVAVPIDYSENTRVLVDELRARLPTKAEEVELA